MIRVNLLGRKATAKAKAKGGGGLGLRLPEIPNLGILVCALMLVIEGAVIYLWQMQASGEADQANSRLQSLKRELNDLQKNRDDITVLTDEVKKLKEQKAVFDDLFAEKVGPVAALQYLSFMLQPRDEAVTPPEELKAMEAAGWRVSWDARKAWITSYREASGEVTLQGRALGHDDVAEVTRRLESSPYFRDPKLVFQENKKDEKLGLGFTEFSIRAVLVYQIQPLVKLPPQPADAVAAAPAAEASPSTAAIDGAVGVTPTTADEAGLIAPKVALPLDEDAGSLDGDAQDSDADTTDTAAAADTSDAAGDADTAADTAKAMTAPSKAATDKGPAKGNDNDKAPAPIAPPAAEPPPAAAADKPPAAE